MTKYYWGIMDLNTMKVIAWDCTRKAMERRLKRIREEDPKGWYGPVSGRQTGLRA